MPDQFCLVFFAVPLDLNRGIYSKNLLPLLCSRATAFPFWRLYMHSQSLVVSVCQQGLSLPTGAILIGGDC